MRSLSAGSAPEAARGTHSIRDFLPQHARGAARAGGQLSLNGIASLHTPHTALCTPHSALCTLHSALRTLHFYLLFTLGVDELAAAAAPLASAKAPANGKQQVTSRWEVAPPMTQMELLLRLAAEGRRKVPSTSLHPFTPHSLFLTPHSSLFKGHHTFLTHHRMHQTATGAGGSRTARGAGGS